MAVNAMFAATFLVTAFLIVTPLAALLHGSFQSAAQERNLFTLRQLG